MISDCFSSLAGDAVGGVHTVLGTLNGDDEAKERDKHNLAEKLRMRLRFAAFKIRRGWQNCTVEEVEQRCQRGVDAKRRALQTPEPASFAEDGPTYDSEEIWGSRAMINGGTLLPLSAWCGAQSTGAELEIPEQLGYLDEAQPYLAPSIFPVQHSADLRPIPAATATEYTAANGPHLGLNYQERVVAPRAVGAQVQDLKLACCESMPTLADNSVNLAADEMSLTTNPFYNARELMLTSPATTPHQASRTSSYDSLVQFVFPDDCVAPCDGVDVGAGLFQDHDIPGASTACLLGSLPHRSEEEHATPASAPPPAGPTLTTTEAAALMVRLSQPQGSSWATASPRHGSAHCDIAVVHSVHNSDYQAPHRD